MRWGRLTVITSGLSAVASWASIAILSGLLGASCKQSDFAGKYTCDRCLIAAIDFRDGRACITASGLGISKNAEAGCFEYTKRGNSYYIKDPRQGEVRFEKKDEKSIKGFGWFEGTYVKK